ncbi:MAG: type II CAAX prenyl endopeptidase Rce1 family protein, partial [Phycisphaerae bacterium]
TAMSNPSDITGGKGGGNWLNRLAADRPDIALIAPLAVYLALLALRDTVLPYEHRWLANLIRGAGGLWVVWLLRRHMPPWGRSHWPLALVMGVVLAAGWYYGQYLFNYLGVPQRIPLPLFSGDPEPVDPRDRLGDGGLFWSTVLTRIVVATSTVAVVEELFWRAFLLRALVDWHKFEKVPLGTFTWRSFLITALLSTLEHPDNWAVSIPCWFAFNALMYWKKSVLFLVFVHGFTNLFLYVWVILNTVYRDDQSAWMFW